uniref:Uncharacterized protein n=1 Tax=Aegilops tauschii subsp. strangulata TaxID=200361 RepID=A0A453S7Z7_AEGTS
ARTGARARLISVSDSGAWSIGWWRRTPPRVSIACFFSTHFHPASTRVYGPIKEVLSDEKPAVVQGDPRQRLHQTLLLHRVRCENCYL